MSFFHQANISFISKLVKSLAPFPFGPTINVLTSSGASNAFKSKVISRVKGANVVSLKDGEPNVSKKDICVFISPSTSYDFNAAQNLATSGSVDSVVIVNAFAKVN